jgi:UDP-glucose 4-epimerase
MSETLKAVVTGGAGFVGSALVRLLLAKGWEVTVYDKLNPGRRDYLPDGQPKLSLEVGDILDEVQITETLRRVQPSVVFHLAAIHYIPYCNAHPLETIRVNVEGTESVLRACRAAETPRVVFASTAAVYPAQAGPLSETMTPGPLDIYGYTKLFGEYLVESHQRETKRTAAIARLFNVYGPRETSPHLIPQLLEQFIEGISELQVGNLEPKRDYVYVDDVARSLYELAVLPCETNTLLRSNVGTGTERSVREVIDALLAISKREVQIVQDPARVRASDRPNLQCDPTRLRSLIGWAPDTDFYQGLAGLLEWTLARRDGQGA